MNDNELVMYTTWRIHVQNENENSYIIIAKAVYGCAEEVGGFHKATRRWDQYLLMLLKLLSTMLPMIAGSL
jgi:hypothetical protein